MLNGERLVLSKNREHKYFYLDNNSALNGNINIWKFVGSRFKVEFLANGEV